MRGVASGLFVAQRTKVAATPRAPIGSMCLTARGIGIATGSTALTRLLRIDTTTLGSDDDGSAWRVVDETVAGPGISLGVACAGERDLWRFGSVWLGGSFGAVLARSEDGGASWTQVAGGDGLRLTRAVAGTFSDRRTGWVCATDGGETWRSALLPDGLVEIRNVGATP